MGPQPVEDENFCLRWNDYEKKYAETFRTLREDEHFADVTLACEGRAVKAHRIILCACSGYFGHILRTINPAQHPVLLLSDVRPTDLTALMDFIYFGQVNITQDSLQSFLKVADKLKIKGLCERAMIAPEPPLQHATIALPVKVPPPPKVALNSPAGGEEGGHAPLPHLLRLPAGAGRLPPRGGAPAPGPAPAPPRPCPRPPVAEAAGRGAGQGRHPTAGAAVHGDLEP